MVLVVISILFKVSLPDVMSEFVNNLYIDVVLPHEIVFLKDLEDDIAETLVTHDACVGEDIKCDIFEVL